MCDGGPALAEDRPAESRLRSRMKEMGRPRNSRWIRTRNRPINRQNISVSIRPLSTNACPISSHSSMRLHPVCDTFRDMFR
jgi:hypothetical protein